MFKEFFNLKQRSLFVIHDLVGVKLLSRLRLKFSHLNELKFRHSFKDPQSPMSYVWLWFRNWNNRPFLLALLIRKFLNSLFKIDVFLKKLNDEMLSDILLFGSDKRKTLSVRRDLFIQLISLKLPNALKGRCFLDRWYHFMTNVLISFCFVNMISSNIACSLPTPQIL